ncbi:KAT8 regulatory NSL complex subunit 1-like protein [Aulostomus maculatus]
MAPALTKILKDGHGIHLSSTPAAVRTDPDSRIMQSMELESPMRSTGEDDLQEMCLYPRDSCLPSSPVDISASQSETELISSPGSLLRFLSCTKGLKESHQVASVFPGVLDMFSVPQYNSAAPPHCGPDGVDVHFSLTNLSPLYSHGEVGLSRIPQASVQPRGVRLNSEQPVQRAVKEQLSRQAELQGRVWRLQKRLQAQLGEQAVLHCSQQLQGLGRLGQTAGGPEANLCSLHPGVLLPQDYHKPCLSPLGSSTSSSSFTELAEFSQSSLAVLQHLQEALDSEATASSSSDEDLEEVRGHRGARSSAHRSSSSSSSSSCKGKWLEERAMLGSRWSWLQLRVADLEGRIMQLMEIHKQIRSAKGGVVLAESQPLADRRIQHTLLREMAGLSCTNSDTADSEPCSPARLLHNIERQSAQLSRIVNSLMPPFTLSPPSKQPQIWEDKRGFTGGSRGDKTFMPWSSKRRRLKADLSSVCARARPLVTYHKPKLFVFKTCNPTSPPDSGMSTSTLSSLSSCSHCSSCDPVVLCSDPDCSSSAALPSRSSSSRSHPAFTLSFDTGLCPPSLKIPAREEWYQEPLDINTQPSSPVDYKRRSSTPLLKSHKCKQHGRHNHKNRIMGLSPITSAGSAQRQHRTTNQRKIKRRRIRRLIEDEEDLLYRLYNPEESLDEVLGESYPRVSHKQPSQGFIRKRRGQREYSINHTFIPMSLTKAEKLQYKDILTPSWRIVDIQPLLQEAVTEDTDTELEVVTDEVFAQRHLALEQKEKLFWSSWGNRKGCRRPTRSGRRLSGSGGGTCTSGEESSVEWSCARLDTDEQPSSEMGLPETPWERRVFPVDDEEEEALFSDNSVLHCPLVDEAYAAHLKEA